MRYNFCVILEKQKRVDMYISTLFEDFSRSYVQKLIDWGKVQVNGKTCKKNIKIAHKDELSIEVIRESYDIKPENIPLDIVYEDRDMMIINKNAGINVHPVPGEWWNSATLVNAILYHCSEELPCISGQERPGIVHRLDKDTSGLIMIAKNDITMRRLSDILKERKIEKYYIAIVYGKLKQTDIEIESYIGRDKNDRKKMTVDDPVNPKIACTKAHVIDYMDNKYTILRVKLETGRTHQIRVHLASIWFPILGDSVYGNKKANTEAKTLYQLKRQALHAYSLEFELYGNTKRFEWPLKSDMMRMIGDIPLNPLTKEEIKQRGEAEF